MFSNGLAFRYTHENIISQEIAFDYKKKGVFYNGSSYYARKAYFPLCSIMNFLFLLNKMLAMTFCRQPSLLLQRALRYFTYFPHAITYEQLIFKS